MKSSLFFHFTDVEFVPGDTLTPQEEGYCHWPESNALETILEHYRPLDKLPRLDAVFLCESPILNGNTVGAAGNGYVLACTVDASIHTQRSDLNWVKEMDQGYDDAAWLEEDYTESQLREWAEGYWSGQGRPGSDPVFEFRAQEATVSIVRTNDRELRGGDPTPE